MLPCLAELSLFIDPAPHDAALNMAVDEVLLATLRLPVLRVYRWAKPAVSFGYFETWDLVRGMHPEREPVRRWTGGGVVPHGEDFTYSLIIPRELMLPAPSSYAWIHGALREALGEAGLPAELAPCSSGIQSRVCFESPVFSDVLVAGRKVAGAAQRRTRMGLLHQGSVQRLMLTEDFSRRFAERLASRVMPRSFDILTEARTLAAQKYGTRAWLERR